ncbi:hypothetical protein [Streptomyces goshikiensis]|uniref:hypothetical protein n=1 Tax=Streptomyces goshikiensis TaxID=1942 RepID=UPI0036F4C1E0
MSAWEQWEAAVAQLAPCVATPAVREAALLEDVDGFGQVFDYMWQQDGRITLVEAKTSAGQLWSNLSHLTYTEESVRKWLSLEPIFDTSPLAMLLGEALGKPLSMGRTRDLRRRYGNTRPGAESGGQLPAWLVRPKAAASELLGAYVLSAGFLRSADTSLPPFSSSTGAYGEWSDGCSEGSFYEFQLAYLVALGRALADLIAVWRADLREALQGWLMPAAYPYADQVPPLACSPCGVIRLASPEIPRGPQLVLQLDAPSPYWVLAA